MSLEERRVPDIKVTPPGPNALRVLERDARLISPSVVRFYPLVVAEADDVIVTDVDGNRYIDFNSGLLCLNVGSRNPRVVNYVKQQLEKFTHYSYTDFYYEILVDLAERLEKLVPVDRPVKFFFSNSGTEAVECALKASRWHTRRQNFIAFIGAFHGRSYGSLSLTASKPAQRAGFFPLLPGVYHAPYAYCYRCAFKLEYPECDLWCVDFIEEYMFGKYVPPEEVAAIIFEPVQGEGGVVVPPHDYFKKLKSLADKYGILMVCDEVQTGVGRTGKWFAVEHFGVKPDIVTIAKAIAAGFPLGVTVAREELMRWPRGSHATTFGANPLSCAAAIATLEEIEERDLLENARRVGDQIIARLRELEEECEIVGDVRGLGLMIGAEVVKDKRSKEPAPELAKQIMELAWKRGVLVITAGVSTLRIAPPLTIPSELADKAMDIVEGCIREVAKGRRR